MTDDYKALRRGRRVLPCDEQCIRPTVTDFQNNQPSVGAARNSARTVSQAAASHPLAAEADERSNVEAARIEIYRDANKTERLLHIQELGIPADPFVSAMIWCPRAERGQSAIALIGVPFEGVEHRALALPATSRPRYPAFMATPAAAKVIAEALALSDEERVAVAEELLASLDPTQSDDSPETWGSRRRRRWRHRPGPVAEPRRVLAVEHRPARHPRHRPRAR